MGPLIRTGPNGRAQLYPQKLFQSFSTSFAQHCDSHRVDFSRTGCATPAPRKTVCAHDISRLCALSCAHLQLLARAIGDRLLVAEEESMRPLPYPRSSSDPDLSQRLAQFLIFRNKLPNCFLIRNHRRGLSLAYKASRAGQKGSCEWAISSKDSGARRGTFPRTAADGSSGPTPSSATG